MVPLKKFGSTAVEQWRHCRSKSAAMACGAANLLQWNCVHWTGVHKFYSCTPGLAFVVIHRTAKRGGGMMHKNMHKM